MTQVINARPSIPELKRFFAFTRSMIESKRQEMVDVDARITASTDFLKDPKYQGGDHEALANGAREVLQTAQEERSRRLNTIELMKCRQEILVRAIEYEKAVEAGPWC